MASIDEVAVLSAVVDRRAGRVLEGFSCSYATETERKGGVDTSNCCITTRYKRLPLTRIKRKGAEPRKRRWISTKNTCPAVGALGPSTAVDTVALIRK
jgi:hypothetical protein